MTNDLRRLASVATGQLGAFSRRQAHEAGVNDQELRRRVQSGFLEQCGPHAFRFPATHTGPLADLQGLVLDVGEPVWISGPTAAALHGFDGFRLRRPFHLTTGRDRNVRRLGAVVHSSGVLPAIDREYHLDLPVTSPVRTIIDLARSEGPRRLAAALDSALRDGKASEDLLHRRIAALRTKGRFGTPRLLDVLEGREITRGGHSWLERQFLRLLAAEGFPRPLTQQVLSKAGDRLVRVDCRFPGTRIVVELLGYRHHRTVTQMRRDAERLNALVLDGFTPYQFTYDQVVNSSQSVCGTLRSALQLAA
jgi:hypothetical protein